VNAVDGPATIATERLVLAPVRVEDAVEMVEVLGDERLYEFIGGRPARLDELHARYARLLDGCANPAEVWLNWVVRCRSDGQAIGTVQATVTAAGRRRSALVAGVIGVAWQGQGFGSEAGRALVDWLDGQGADEIAAHVLPRHHASAAVATRAGLHRTNEQVEGEDVWRTTERREG
jgi:RimJ/RimL family protein N-acetyltransferase